MELKAGVFVIWKWKDDKTYKKSYIQDCLDTEKGKLLELTDSNWYSNYPTRILVSDIDILCTNP